MLLDYYLPAADIVALPGEMAASRFPRTEYFICMLREALLVHRWGLVLSPVKLKLFRG